MRAAGLAPGKFCALELFAARGELLVDRLDRLGVKAYAFLRGPGCVLMQIVCREKLAGTLGVLVRQFVVVVPHQIDLARQAG